MNDRVLALALTVLVLMVAGTHVEHDSSQQQRPQRHPPQTRRPAHSVLQPTEQGGDRIPDFSNCGYVGGGVDLPASGGTTSTWAMASSPSGNAVMRVTAGTTSWPAPRWPARTSSSTAPQKRHTRISFSKRSNNRLRS